MAVQAHVFQDNLRGFQPNASSQDWIGMSSNSGFGLPDPFPNLVQPVPVVDGLLDTLAHVSTPPNLRHPVSFSNALADGFEPQTREIDMFLQLQNERLRYAIQQQNKKQIATLLNSIGPKAVERVRKIEQDLARVTRRTRELEECLRRAEMEAGAWKRMAMENEAMVLGLNNMLVQARERLSWASCNGGPAQDVESVCECDWAEEDGTRGCKGCKTQRCSVVFLPCRHLCACRQCGSLLGMCPVCEAVKEGTIQVFF